MFDHLPVWDHLEAAVAAGYSAVELRSTHAKPDSDPAYLDAIKDYCDQNGLSVLALSCFVGNFGLADDTGCQDIYEQFKQYVTLAHKMDTDMIRLWPAWQESATAPAEVWDRAVEWCRKCCDYAAQQGKKVVFEMHHGTLCDTLDACKRLIEAVDCDNAGFILDPVNLYQVPAEDVKEYIYTLKGKIFIVHVKDIIRLPGGDFPYSFAYRFYAGHIGRFTKVIPPDPSRDDYYAHRRINQGGVDWSGILKALTDIGYDGYLTVESVNETNKLMPEGRALALACYEDLQSLLAAESKQKSWNIVSPAVPGLHEVISPDFRDCVVSNILRLNLMPGQRFALESGAREMNALLVSGSAGIELDGHRMAMDKLDSFYVPGGHTVQIKAGGQGCAFYIGAAVCEGYGAPFFRKLDLSLPLGDIHQIHGSGSMAREVFFTLDPGTPASRLLCGVSWSSQGGWTSWPPHQHEKDLEEVYCYLDTGCGLHLGYTQSGDVNNINFFPVKSGHMVLAPKGYHPTVAMPNSQNAYFWVLTAFRHDSRRYDLAVSDPAFEPGK